MERLILVGCGKTKLAHRARAKTLYTGNLFQAARAYAEQSGAPWRVLSARYGAVSPNEMIEPYDHRLKAHGIEPRQWANSVAHTIMLHHGLDLVVEILAGVDYAAPLVSVLADRFPSIVCSTPLAGLQVGQRLAWFKRERECRGLTPEQVCAFGLIPPEAGKLSA